jgi:acylphosphatase
MRVHNLLRRKSLYIATSISCALVTIAPQPAQSDVQNATAVSGIATGKVQEVGFRAMIQKQAIQYNLAGSAENNKDKSVRFILQGIEDRIDKALKHIRKGTKKSSNVTVSVSPASIDPNLKTFTVVDWTSESRHICHPYNLVFNLRPSNKTIKKDNAKRVWLDICEKTVKGEDSGKCNKNSAAERDRARTNAPQCNATRGGREARRNSH